MLRTRFYLTRSQLSWALDSHIVLLSFLLPALTRHASRGSRTALSGLLPFLIISALLLAGVFLFYRHPGRTGAGGQCLQDYHRARTAADTILVDSHVYWNGKVGPVLTCGFLRQSGELSR